MSTPAFDFERVAEDLMAVAANVRIGEVFGVPALTADGRAVAALDEKAGGMAFKLTDDGARDEAMGLDGADAWDPRSSGRAVADWVLVPHEHADAWADLARRAVDAYL
ncbi:MAG TPA: hypothetical protein VF640_03090 [Acidimicrobiales bacterium]